MLNLTRPLLMSGLRPVAVAVTVLIVLAFPQTSEASGLFHRKAIPACDSQKVLTKIKRRFNQAEKIYWQRGYRLSGIRNAHFHSDYTPLDSPIARHYCHGHVDFEDGKTRKIHFLIESGAGFAGFGWNVEYCIHGLDPWHYYDGNCRVIHR